VKTRIVLELRQQYPLAGLLKVAGLARSTFYYQQKVLQMGDKYASLKAKIQSVFDAHKGRYGYRCQRRLNSDPPFVGIVGVNLTHPGT
jgi:hypothetical protein